MYVIRRKNWIFNNANMELKNFNPNGDNIKTSNQLLLLFKIVKIGFKNEEHMLFYYKNAMIVWKTKCLILLTSQINIEWIKASPIGMDIFYKKKKLLIFWKFS
jgi:hypothetical protein